MGKATITNTDPPSILHLVKQVQYRAYVRLEAVFQPLGITAAQFRILTTLSARPGLTSADLARVYDVKPQTMIKQVALLEAKGLIDRTVSASNKRLLELRLSTVGEASLKLCHTQARALEDELLAPLDPAEQDQLRDQLLRLRDALRADVPCAGDPDGAEFTSEYRSVGVQRV